MSGGILSGGILERGDIVRGDFVLGGYCPGGYCPGDIVRGDIVRGDIVLIPFYPLKRACPDGILCKPLPLTASCLSRLPGFESQLGRVRKLPETSD